MSKGQNSSILLIWSLIWSSTFSFGTMVIEFGVFVHVPQVPYRIPVTQPGLAILYRDTHERRTNAHTDTRSNMHPQRHELTAPAAHTQRTQAELLSHKRDARTESTPYRRAVYHPASVDPAGRPLLGASVRAFSVPARAEDAGKQVCRASSWPTSSC